METEGHPSHRRYETKKKRKRRRRRKRKRKRKRGLKRNCCC